MSENLMDGLINEMNRVRELVQEYEMPELNGAGRFAAAFMKASIRKAEDSIKENDVIKMLSAYQDLKDYNN